MKTFLDLVRSRRSVRVFTDQGVTAEELAAILEAGRLAPSGNNTQPWRFIVVRDAKLKARLADVAGEQSWLAAAPVVIAVVADAQAKLPTILPSEADVATNPAFVTATIKSVRDAAIAAEHLVLAATDLGLGTCWVGKYDQAPMRAVLSVPEECYVVTLLPIGRPAERPSPTPRHALSEIVFEERYGGRPHSSR
jgi:nitroreductase